MSRCDLDFSLLTLNFGCHAFKLYTKFERNRIILGWVILTLLHVFAVQFGGRVTERFSGVRGPRFTKLGEDVGRSWRLHKKVVSVFGYRAAFSNVGSSNLSDVENDAKFRALPYVKIRGEVGEISIPIIEALPTTEPPEYIWWPSTARLLSAMDWKKKKKKIKKVYG